MHTAEQAAAFGLAVFSLENSMSAYDVSQINLGILYGLFPVWVFLVVVGAILFISDMKR